MLSNAGGHSFNDTANMLCSMLRNKWVMQGATWMYEAIVGPTFQLILKEAVKIPSIDRLVNQTDLVCPTLACCTSHSIAHVLR